jgi:hypothetical protein
MLQETAKDPRYLRADHLSKAIGLHARLYGTNGFSMVNIDGFDDLLLYLYGSRVIGKFLDALTILMGRGYQISRKESTNILHFVWANLASSCYALADLHNTESFKESCSLAELTIAQWR